MPKIHTCKFEKTEHGRRRWKEGGREAERERASEGEKGRDGGTKVELGERQNQRCECKGRKGR